MIEQETARDWAEEVFGRADLGDTRRTRRLVALAAEAAERPGGKVLDVCVTSATRQGAYGLLGNDKVTAGAIQSAVTMSTALRCTGDCTLVVLDGTSLSLSDRYHLRDFGSIGATNWGKRGLKVINAYALSSSGVPVGLLGQKWWAREGHSKRRDCQRRTVDEKETKYWVRAIDGAAMMLSATGSRGWFQLDREADGYLTLKALHDSGHWYTVRSAHAHRRLVGEPITTRLRHAVSGSRPRHGFVVSIAGQPGRQRREAQLQVRTVRVTLRMKELVTGNTFELPINVVDVLEVGSVPRGEKPIHWRLLTNRSVETRDEVDAVIKGYAHRWRIEELHKTWKSGACNIEKTQLHSAQAVMKWATIMAATAARIERLKYLARREPDTPADAEFSIWEIKAAVLLRRRYKKRTDPPPGEAPPISEIVMWIAELGGYTGKSSGGPPGSITIRRGLERLSPVAAALEQQAIDSQM